MTDSNNDAKIKHAVTMARRLTPDDELKESRLVLFEKYLRDGKRDRAYRILYKQNLCGAKRMNNPDGLRCLAKPVKGKRRCPRHGGCSTGPRTPEGRQRIADANRARWAKMKAEGRERNLSPEARERIAAAQRERWREYRLRKEDYRRQLEAGADRVNHIPEPTTFVSPEGRERVAAAQRERWHRWRMARLFSDD